MEEAAVRRDGMTSEDMELAAAAAEQVERGRKNQTFGDVESKICELIDVARQGMPVEDAAFLFSYVWVAAENIWKRQLIMIKGSQLGNYR
jgi:hypothetical protein